MNRCACLVIAIALAAVPALANIPFPDLCVLDNAAGSDGATVFNVPDGSGAAFTEARAAGGALVDATLTLTGVNSLGNPIANYPAADIWLVTTGGGLATCGSANPGAATDANGQTTWSAALNAGGSSLGEQAQAVIAGDPVPDTANIAFVSADLGGDLQVNLSDITVFTQALNTYNAAADYNNDAIVNLTDITIFSQAVGAVCP